MRKLISFITLAVVAASLAFAFTHIPFGEHDLGVARYYLTEGVTQTGAVNLVTSVVVNYRGLDTLGEITVLFIAAVGLGTVLFAAGTAPMHASKKADLEPRPASLILRTGTRLLFPFILLFGVYVFLHGHLTPGGGFQGGAIIASGFLLMYLAFPQRRTTKRYSQVIESLGGLIFVGIGLLGLIVSGSFLINFLPKGVPRSLFSGGIIPIIYVAVGLKVGFELTGIICGLLRREADASGV